MSVGRHARTDQRLDDGEVIAGRREPQSAVAGMVGRGRVGAACQKQRQNLDCVRVGSDLQ